MHLSRFFSLAAVLCIVFLCTSSFVYVAQAQSGGEVSEPRELWRFTATNTTQTTIRMSWQAPQVGDGVVIVANYEMHKAVAGQEYPQHLIQTLYSIDAASGAKLWNFTDLSSIQFPVLVDGVVYFGASHYFYAVDAKNGVQKWAYSTGLGVSSQPVVIDGTVYVSTVVVEDGYHVGYVSALNAESGDELWKTSLNCSSTTASLAVADGVVYVSGPDYNLYALRAANGVKQWNFSINRLGTTDLVVSNGIVYFGTGGTCKEFYAVNIDDGTEVWGYPVGLESDTPPVVVGDVVYFNTLENNVYAFDATSGDKLWNFSYPTSGFQMSPVVVGEALYFRGVDEFYALDLNTGAQLWSRNVGRVVSFEVVDKTVYYNAENTFGALNAAEGAPVWSYTTDYELSPLAIVDGVTYFGGGTQVYALDVSAESAGVRGESWLGLDTTAVVAIAVAVVVVAALALVLIVKRRQRQTATTQ